MGWLIPMLTNNLKDSSSNIGIIQRPRQELRQPSIERLRRITSLFSGSFVKSTLTMLLLPCLSFAGTFTAFGPTTYTRTTGAPVTVSKTFSILDPTTQYTLHIQDSGVYNAVISINGRQVLGPSDFDPLRTVIDIPVIVQASSKIDVQLRSSPGSSLTISIVGVDNVPPSISALGVPAANSFGWNNTNVTVGFTCSDKTSGIALCPNPVAISTEGTAQLVTGTAVDVAGNKASASLPVSIDKTPPIISPAVAPAPNNFAWNNTPVVVSFACTDALSRILSCTPPLTVSTEGLNQRFTGTASDKAGNSASSSASVNIDFTPPTITATSFPASNSAGWNNTDVTVTFHCADTLSGVASCPGGTIVSTEGKNQIVQGTVSDKAGNLNTGAASINLDKTPPVVNIASPVSGTVVHTPLAAIAGSATDALSGIAAVRCNGVAATIIGTSFACSQSLIQGINSIEIDVTDVAGNTTSTSTSVAFVRFPQIKITSPAQSALFNQSPITVSGTLDDPSAQVTVNGITAPVSGSSFLATVPVQEGISTITAVATNADGSTTTASTQVNLDTTPPHVAIYSPSDKLVTTDSSITVTGLVNDIVIGTVNPQQASVSVNRVPAQVANRTFSASVPLSIGSNTVQAIAVDAAGNAATISVIVIRQVTAGQPVVRIFSGNNQSGAINTQLAQPLVAQLLNASGQPVANTPVVFRVTGQDGTLGTSQGGGLSGIAANTDAQGLASALFTVGSHAGAGNNRVEASSTGVSASATFSASGLSTGAALINVDSGNNQTGVIGQTLPLPFIAVVTDQGHNRIADVPVTFTVKNGSGNLNGQPSITVNSDSDGRIQALLTLGPAEGINNNLVEATFAGNSAFGAAFTATGRASGPAVNTAIAGVVLDNSNQPIPGVTMRILQLNQGPSGNLPQQLGTPVQTDAQGQFVIQPAPVGVFKLMADGGTATREGPWPTLEYDIITISGQNNTVGSPIYLPRLNPANQICVTASTGGTLTIPEAPGFALTIAPGSATFPGGSKTGCVTVTPVNMDKVPMVPGFGQQPRFVVTIQPVGTSFNPPAGMTMPNVDGLKPRAVTEMYSYDHDLASFVAIGTATVSDDGSVIKSDPGVGVLKAGWHCGGDPNNIGSAGTCPDCYKCDSNSCIVDVAQIDLVSPISDQSINLNSVRAGAPISPGNNDTYGLTDDESIEPTITARCNFGLFSADLIALVGNFSEQVRLLPGPPAQQEVTGIGGNTNQTNFCAQVSQLECLGNCQPFTWYMLGAVKAHEDVHQSRLLPTLIEAAPDIEAVINAVSIPIANGVTKQQAPADIKALPEWQAALLLGRAIWDQRYVVSIALDHVHGIAGGTDEAEHSVIDPMVAAICAAAKARGWSSCASCP
jgi:hypothetical protein